MADESQWHLDKRVPIGIIGAIIFQTITFVALGSQWMAKTDLRLDALERATDERKTQGDRLIVLEQKLGFIKDTVETIARRLEGIDTRAKEDRLRQ